MGIGATPASRRQDPEQSGGDAFAHGSLGDKTVQFERIRGTREVLGPKRGHSTMERVHYRRIELRAGAAIELSQRVTEVGRPRVGALR
jgi:hypothetical protein